MIGSGVHRAMSTLDSPAIAGLLAQLFAQADRGDQAAFERADAALNEP
jgi:hypothetical protein